LKEFAKKEEEEILIKPGGYRIKSRGVKIKIIV